MTVTCTRTAQIQDRPRYQRLCPACRNYAHARCSGSPCTCYPCRRTEILAEVRRHLRLAPHSGLPVHLAAQLMALVYQAERLRGRPARQNAPQSYCPVCGKPLAQVAGSRARTTCSGACRTALYRQRARQRAKMAQQAG